MSLSNVIKWEINTGELAHKFPVEDLKLGSHLIVYPGQIAIFVKGGQILQIFKDGTYTIDTENIPLLNKIYNLQYGGVSPFKAEVWFINTISLLDFKWGTPAPIQIEDPKYNVIVPIRVHGQYGLKIENPRLFFERLVGNMNVFTTTQIGTYFRSIIVSRLNSLISKTLYADNLSIININTRLDEISEYGRELLKESFTEYGVNLEYFSVASINVDESDPSFVKLKEIKDSAARINIMGKDNYQMERSYDVLEIAAGNEGGFVSTAVGIGAGLNIGNQIGNMAYQYIYTNPPMNYVQSSSESYHVIANGNQIGPVDLSTIIDLIKSNTIDGVSKIWKRGLSNWVSIVDLPEFSSFFPSTPPPLS